MRSFSGSQNRIGPETHRARKLEERDMVIGTLKVDPQFVMRAQIDRYTFPMRFQF